MGGGGGGYFSSSMEAGKIARKVRSAEERAVDAGYEASVNELLGGLLAAANTRDVEETSRLTEQIRKDLERELGVAVKLQFGGSVAKKTYVEGLSDVDVLVLINKGIADSVTPAELRDTFAATLRDRFGRDSVRQGNLAVTVKVDGAELQLLPAVRRGEGFAISSSDGAKWSEVNPQKFAEKLTASNQALSGKLVPVIKLAKAIQATWPPQRALTGYHSEALAINAFRNYSGPLTLKSMIVHYFDRARELVLEPIKDSSGQSVHVDADRLGGAGSVERRIVSDAMERMHRRMLNADGAQSLAVWKQFLE